MNEAQPVKLALLSFCYKQLLHLTRSHMTPSPAQYVLITCASTGIGAECAVGCAARSMTVFAGVRTQEAGERLCRQSGGVITPVHLDVTDDDSIHRVATQIGGVVGK